jgi:exosome complex RNA-binding protein Rrp42 (RNase PH superfamily)
MFLVLNSHPYRGKLINLLELCLLEDEFLLSLKVNLTVLSNQGNLKDCVYYATVREQRHQQR